MRAKIVKEWRAAPQGHTVVVMQPGTIIEGPLAQVAISEGVAESIGVLEIATKIDPPPEKKRRGRPPKNRDLDA